MAALVLEQEVHRRLVELPVETMDEGSRRRVVHDLVRAVDPVVGGSALAEVVERVLARVNGLGPLEPLLADPGVTEVMVNGPGQVWVERAGTMHCTDTVLDDDTIAHLVERIVTPLGRRVDRVSPLLDARLPDGSRVNIVLSSVALDGTCITIRRFGVVPLTLAAVTTPGTARLLEWAVAARLNLLVSGGTGAGKTTLLNILAATIPTTERIVTIEDAAELRLPAPHVVRLEARPPSPDGLGEVTIRDLVRNALRMRPDRIVVGEVRGPEALDMLQAMNTGHEGSLCTCHANGPADALRRLETMVLQADVALPLSAVREQLVSAVDLIVQVGRIGDQRRVVAVSEVVDNGARVRSLAAPAGLHALPSRPARRALAPPPSPSWIEVEVEHAVPPAEPVEPAEPGEGPSWVPR